MNETLARNGLHKAQMVGLTIHQASTHPKSTTETLKLF